MPRPSTRRLVEILPGSAPVNITGTGAVTFAHPTLAATATETFSASGGVAIGRPSLAASGTVSDVFGTAAVTIGAPLLAASATETITGTGAVAFLAPALAGSATETITGTAAVTISHPALALTGESPDVYGTAGVTIGHSALAGTATYTFQISAAGGISISRPALAIRAMASGTGIDMWADLREGDIIRIISPYTAPGGESPLVRILSRRYADGEPYPELTLQFIDPIDASTRLSLLGELGTMAAPPPLANTETDQTAIVTEAKDQVRELQMRVAAVEDASTRGDLSFSGAALYVNSTGNIIARRPDGTEATLI